MSEPIPIPLADLDHRLRSEASSLQGDDLAWWNAHRIEPFLLPRYGLVPYAIARSGEKTLVYFDDREAFGQYAREPWNDSLILDGSLADAVRRLTTQDSMNRLLAETASGLLKLGVFERGDVPTRIRALQVLRAIGPESAVAVPRLISLTISKTPLDCLEEDAVATLAAIGSGAAAAVPRLIEMAERDTANARAWCLVALESIGPAAVPAVPLLIDILLKKVSVDPHPYFVSMAADALGNIGAIEALPALLQTFQETNDPVVAIAVVQAIGKLGPAAVETGPLLAGLVEDYPPADRFSEDTDLRSTAIKALDRVRRPPPIPQSEPE